MFERFKSLPQVWCTGRLALRLVRDPRVPTAAKLLFGAAVLYMLSPIDVVPDWLPVLGQADDLVVLMAGLNLFLRACPKWLVEEHEDALGSPREDRPPVSRGPARGPTIDGDYQPIR
jgi:uncharacterized membrane protein YkvA (DUF1232 family)